MTKKFCPYCGQPLSEGCDCAGIAEEERRDLIDYLEDRQEKSGMYAQQDLIDMYRREVGVLG